MPRAVSDELKDLKDSSECKRLVRTLAEWMVLIELCKDLLSRVETYDISILMAEMLDGHLEKGWAVDREPLKKHAKSTFSSLTEFLMSFGHHVISICELVGITSHYEHIVSTAAVGALHSNPTVCIASVIGLWFGKFAVHSYSDKSAKEEL